MRAHARVYTLVFKTRRLYILESYECTGVEGVLVRLTNACSNANRARGIRCFKVAPSLHALSAFIIGDHILFTGLKYVRGSSCYASKSNYVCLRPLLSMFVYSGCVWELHLMGATPSSPV